MNYESEREKSYVLPFLNNCSIVWNLGVEIWSHSMTLYNDFDSASQNVI